MGSNTLLNSLSMLFTVMLFFFSLISMLMGLYFYNNMIFIYMEWEILLFESSSVCFLVLLDWISLIFLWLVSLISSMVMWYSFGYMSTDLYSNRFLVLIFLFVLSMMLMIISPNVISILLGWDGLGLVSYGLVIYYQNIKSYNSGMITVLTNRIGDVAIILSIGWLLNYSYWDFKFLEMHILGNEKFYFMVVMMLAAMTKSAQVPFSAWLPAAMAAPTPVSALVHSSTLVTAGVYLLIRFSALLENISLYLFMISVVTMFMSGFGAIFEYDLKKIIALSTLSQLGVMMMILSLNMVELAYFHLVSHALFKSLLFLCAGVFIHDLIDSQDIRLFSSLSISHPLVNIFFFCCSISLCGFPFLAGFYSKDLILEFSLDLGLNMILIFFVYISILFTVVYSFRLMYYIIFKNSKWLTISVMESEMSMMFSMGVLFNVSVVVGSLFSWFFLSPMLMYFELFMKFIILMSLLLIMMFWSLKTLLLKFSINNIIFLNLKNLMTWFFGSMWYMYYLFSLTGVYSILSGLSWFKMMDQGWGEMFGGLGGMNLLMSSSTLFDKWNMLFLKSFMYLFFFLILMWGLLNF